MKLVLFSAAMLVIAAPSARADDVVTLRDDVLFSWRNDTDRHGRHGACGFIIQGNHISRQDPKVVWDINIDEIFDGPDRIVGVSAGTFDVAGKERRPRAPITGISFSYEGGKEPVPVTIVGPPNASNGVRGTIEVEKAKPLLEAFALNKWWIMISLTYGDGRSETLRTKGLTGGQGGSSKMNDYARCVRGDTLTNQLRR